MTSVLRHVLCCCCGRRPHSPGDGDEADEHTPFIRPQSNGEEPSNANYVVNHEALKDRLGTIVRAKESKMVNVSTDLPFNLANKVLHGRLGDLEASTSSSRSPSAHAASGGVSGSSPDPSPSIQTSRSNSSLHPGDASYLPPEADPTSGLRGPILSARLVRKPGSGGFGVGGVTDSNDSLSTHFEANGESAPGNGLVIQVEGTGEVLSGDADVDTTLKTPRASEIHAIPEKDFGVIQDVGKITCSWGD
ncbi:hypothetical protein BDY19DRAFT_210671 [Irpex rosettiformis]|uniref:Uncharacterized protein n=1 Tax=Irpex rosettiformis TaxID=378272 RepID=A0ACB8U206_9APHY|nr:hypothetical protein BDY19DRAFT_210671 [Irpex rosettiformis]